MTPNEPITKEDFCRRFVDYMGAADALDAEANRIDGLAWADRFGLRLAARFLRTYKGSPAKEERS